MSIAPVTVPAILPQLLLLLIRLVLAIVFISSARGKSKKLRAFAKSNGLPLPMARLVVLAEGLSGLSLLVGFAPLLAALVIMVLMCNTMALHIFKWHSPYWANKGGWEYDLMIFCLAGAVVLGGGGVFSIWDMPQIIAI